RSHMCRACLCSGRRTGVRGEWQAAGKDRVTRADAHDPDSVYHDIPKHSRAFLGLRGNRAIVVILAIAPFLTASKSNSSELKHLFGQCQAIAIQGQDYGHHCQLAFSKASGSIVLVVMNSEESWTASPKSGSKL